MRLRELVAAMLAVAGGLALFGCARCGGTGDAEHVYYPGNGTCEDLASLRGRADLAQAPFAAVLSATAYAVDQRTRQPTGTTVRSMREFCDAKDSFYLPPGFETLDPAKYPDPGKPRFGWDLGGLSYLVFARRTPGQPTQVYVAFRGTDDDIGDWFSNLRWGARALFFLHDEYDQVLRILAELGRVLHREYGDDAVITTLGHSLGGGLAQLAAYGFPQDGNASRVSRVYAFDPSPVTGYYSVDARTRQRNEAGLRIARIYDHGEILAYLRLIMKGLYPVSAENPEITEMRFNLLRGGVVRQHGMRRFSCALWEAFGGRERDGRD